MSILIFSDSFSFTFFFAYIYIYIRTIFVGWQGICYIDMIDLLERIEEEKRNQSRNFWASVWYFIDRNTV